jgi:hypothetical protein
VHDFTPAAPDAARLGYASHLQFAADGRSLLLFNGELRLVEVASGQERLRVGNLGAGLNCMALSPDGRLAARGSSDGTLTVYATASGKELMQRKGRQGMVTALAFSDDGRLLASGGSNGSILVWKMPAPPPPETTLTDARRAELWGQLASADAAVAGRAVEALAAAPGPAVELIRQRLKAAAGRTDAKRLEKCIADLDSDSFIEREKASRELAAAGRAAEGLLRKALDKAPSAEARRRVQELLERLEGETSLDRVRAVRAVEVLERIGTPAARKALAELAKEVDDALAEEVQASLERLR